MVATGWIVAQALYAAGACAVFGESVRMLLSQWRRRARGVKVGTLQFINTRLVSAGGLLMVVRSVDPAPVLGIYPLFLINLLSFVTLAIIAAAIFVVFWSLFRVAAALLGSPTPRRTLITCICLTVLAFAAAVGCGVATAFSDSQVPLGVFLIVVDSVIVIGVALFNFSAYALRTRVAWLHRQMDSMRATKTGAVHLGTRGGGDGDELSDAERSLSDDDGGSGAGPGDAPSGAVRQRSASSADIVKIDAAMRHLRNIIVFATGLTVVWVPVGLYYAVEAVSGGGSLGDLDPDDFNVVAAAFPFSHILALGLALWQLKSPPGPGRGGAGGSSRSSVA